MNDLDGRQEEHAAQQRLKAARIYNHCRNPECRARVPRNAGVALCPSCEWIRRKAFALGVVIAGPFGALVGGLITGWLAR